jgi:hypothetical protein
VTKNLVAQVINFTEQCRLNPNTWQFASTPGGPETLYASAFACMLLHYTGHLDTLAVTQKQAWADYLNSWQDEATGYFLGPEMVPAEINSRKHSFEHISQHLAAHVLPALSLLGAQPRYPLTFARPFTNLGFLQNWLEARDWRDAWLEGNNLIFVGQFLIYLRDVEKISSAQSALELYFDWLDKEIDPHTGLWGSNGYCSRATALYGGYHQLLVYYYENRPVLYPQRLVDVALSLQHADGGFHPDGGGGACEDVDTVDILVNMYKQVNYKRPEIRIALRKGLQHILARQMADGGFVYRLDQSFVHMGVQKTASPPNQSNLFSTWFRVHTLALISQILTDEPVAQFNWQFNNSCSMGWHRPWETSKHVLAWPDRQAENLSQFTRRAGYSTRAAYLKGRNFGGRIKRRLFLWNI